MGVLKVLVEQFLLEKFSRYVEENVRRSSEYRRYNKALPKWLNDRPYAFTKHCIEKLSMARDIKPENIKFVETVNKCYLLVTSSIDHKVYKVHLRQRNNSSYPCCDCERWKRTLLPCKHMISIFEHLSEYSWDKLPEKYSQSPYFKIDTDVISVFYDVTDTSHDPNGMVKDNGISAYSKLPPARHYPKRQLPRHAVSY